MDETGYTGPTICPDGSYCQKDNDYFSQCLPGVAPPPPPPPPPSPPPPAPQEWYYIFTFGDSWTSTGFNIHGSKPALPPGNQIGNPAFPGITHTGQENWLGQLIDYNPQLLAYNFASEASTINSSIIASPLKGATSLSDQVSQFIDNLTPPPASAPWYFNSTLFAIWSGNTDVFLASDEADWPAKSNQLLETYKAQVTRLMAVGGRAFLFLNIPPIDRTPGMLKQSKAKRAAIASAITMFNTALSDYATALANESFWGDYTPNFAAGSPGFAQLVNINDAWTHMLNYNETAAVCTNPDGVSCFWVNDWYPGWTLVNLAMANAAVQGL